MSSSFIGRTLGKYQITEFVGQGGMATVYKGYQPDVDRYVAVKVLPPHPGQDTQFIERFRQEARTIARLQHPHILPLYDYGNEDDILYLVMAYVSGGSLADRMRKGPLSLEDIENLLRQVAGALDYAHRQGVIHRDIKPDNILLDGEGNVLLADFGIAKLAETTGGTLTATGGIVGTPAYMAPEQGQGLPVEKYADIYSLGIVTYEMLSGRLPFNADTPMQVVLKHITEPVPNLTNTLSSMPSSMDAVMQRALAKEPTQRYPTAGEFATAFAKSVRGTLANLQIDFSATGSISTAIPDTVLKVERTTDPNTQQTILVQQSGTNPLVLLGGFAIIAIMLVAIVFVVVTQFRPADPETSLLLTPPPGVDSNTTFVFVTDVPDVTAAPTLPPVPNFGRLGFSTAASFGDTINMSVERLDPPGDDRVYAVWLLSAVDNTPLMLGELRVDALGSGVLSYIDPQGRNLSTLYYAVAITVEEEMSEAPSGDVVYSGAVPVQVTAALTHLLGTGSPDDSLIQGALREATIGAQHAGLAAGASSVPSMKVHAEHTINILLGTEDDLDGSGSGQNPARGIGIEAYLSRIEADIDRYTSAPGAGVPLQVNAENTRVCMNNVRAWSAQIVELERQLLATNDLESVSTQLEQSTQLANTLINGVDLDGGGQIDPFEGECGLKQIQTYALLVASLEIIAGPVQVEYIPLADLLAETE